jgi:vancomycin resistance protein YoaR
MEGMLMEPRTRVKKKNIWGKVFLIFFLAIFIVAIGGTVAYGYQILNLETFYEGVEVDGIPLGTMTREEALDAIKAHNQPKLDEIQITLIHGDKKWEFDYRDINAQIDIEEVVDEAFLVGRQGTIVDRFQEIYHITNEPRKYETTLTYDVSLLEDKVKAIAGEINEEPVDATIEFNPDNKEKFSFTPDKKGIGILVDKTMEILHTRVDAGDFSAINIVSEELLPKLTLEEVKTWTSRIGYYSTPLNDNSNRNHNIKLSSKAYYNLRLEPGEVFSLNEATGPRGAAQGYRAAPVIKDGNRYEDAPGGGNCQTSTTLYGAALRADLEIVERSPHSIMSSYTPIGTDAAVSYPYTDFKFRNNKDTPIFVTRYISKGRLHVEIYGKPSDEYDEIKIVSWETGRTDVPEYKIVKDPQMYEGEEEIEYKSRAGVKAVSYKVYYKDGQEIKREKAANSSYRRIQGLKRVGTKKKPVAEAPEKPKDEKPKDDKPKDDKPKQEDPKPKDPKPEDPKPKDPEPEDPGAED